MLYIVLIDPWCNVIFVNVPVPGEEKSDDKRDSFCGIVVSNLLCS